MTQLNRAAIVVIDDDLTLAWMMRRLLEKLIPGYPIYTCGNGTDALRYIAHNPVCCVITDYRLPFMDGLEITQQIKEQWPTVPVIFLTGSRSSSIHQMADAAGASAVLEKPPSSHVLENVIRPLLMQPTSEAFLGE